jgi:hypothetical protein
MSETYLELSVFRKEKTTGPVPVVFMSAIYITNPLVRQRFSERQAQMITP